MKRFNEVNIYNCIESVLGRFIDTIYVIKVVKKPVHVTWVNSDKIEIYLKENCEIDNFVYTLLNYEYELMYSFTDGCYFGMTDNEKHVELLNIILCKMNIDVESITCGYVTN